MDYCKLLEFIIALSYVWILGVIIITIIEFIKDRESVDIWYLARVVISYFALAIGIIVTIGSLEIIVWLAKLTVNLICKWNH